MHAFVSSVKDLAISYSATILTDEMFPTERQATTEQNAIYAYHIIRHPAQVLVDLMTKVGKLKLIFAYYQQPQRESDLFVGRLLERIVATPDQSQFKAVPLKWFFMHLLTVIIRWQMGCWMTCMCGRGQLCLRPT